MNNEFVYKILPEPLRGRWKYIMLADYWIHVGIIPKKKIKLEFLELDRRGILTLLKGYMSDGASGPARDTANIMRAAFVHDALYQLLRLLLLQPFRKMRRKSDKVFRRISKEDGVVMVRRFVDFWGLRWFGKRSATKKGEKS